MMASKMTNEQLAHNLEATIPFLMKEARHLTDADEIMTEAAARLRALSTLTTHTDNSEVIAELERKYAYACKCCDDAERRLKVAKNALGESRVAICHICDLKHQCGHGTANFDPCCIYKDIDSALATIRGKGGAK